MRFEMHSQRCVQAEAVLRSSPKVKQAELRLEMFFLIEAALRWWEAAAGESEEKSDTQT